MGNGADQDHSVYTVKGVLAPDTSHRKISLFRLPGAPFAKNEASFVRLQEKKQNTTACDNYRPMWVN